MRCDRNFLLFFKPLLALRCQGKNDSRGLVFRCTKRLLDLTMVTETGLIKNRVLRAGVREVNVWAVHATSVKRSGKTALAGSICGLTV